jgi:hypothetical protein
LAKNGFGYILDDFLTNASGHPGHNQENTVNEREKRMTHHFTGFDFLFDSCVNFCFCGRVARHGQDEKNRTDQHFFQKKFPTESRKVTIVITRGKRFSRRIPPKPGLPDGICSNQKSRFGLNFGGSCDGRCCYILWPSVNYLAIWYILWSFCTFFQFGVLYQKKSGNPGRNLEWGAAEPTTQTILSLCVHDCLGSM